MKNEIRPDYDEVYMFPPAVEDWLDADHPARFIRAFVDSLDLDSIGFKTRKVEVGAPSYSVDLLLKVWLYGCMTKVRSTRGLERACMDSMALIWLTGNHAPDHNTLWRFSKDNGHLFKKLFGQSIRVAMKSGLIGLALHAVDGTKIRSRASKRKGLHREDLEKLMKRMEESVDEMLSEVEENERIETGEVRLPKELQDPKVLKGRIEEALREMDEEGVEHYNPGDPEARMMRGVAGTEFSYNAQAVVDSRSGLIVGADVVNAGNDNHLLNDMLDEVEENVGEVADETVADAGYYSSEELAKAEENGRSVLVNMQRMSGGEREGEFHSSRFTYDAERDCVICPLGRELSFSTTQKRGNGLVMRVYRCCESDCASKHKCTKSKTGRTIKIGPYHEAMVHQREKQRDSSNRHRLRRRKAIVECVFGTIKEAMGFRRWSVAGLEKVKALWALICVVFNLKKLHKHWVQGKLILRPFP